jgi:predicted amidophosphoribosyltransferase
MSKLFEKLLLKRLKPIIDEKHLVPVPQFRFRKKSLDNRQVHRISEIIEKHLETKECALLSFLTLHKLSTE